MRTRSEQDAFDVSRRVGLVVPPWAMRSPGLSSAIDGRSAKRRITVPWALHSVRSPLVPSEPFLDGVRRADARPLPKRGGIEAGDQRMAIRDLPTVAW